MKRMRRWSWFSQEFDAASDANEFSLESPSLIQPEWTRTPTYVA